MGQLDGKIALVTGSSRSIGKAIAIALAKEGAKLVLAARTIAGLEATAVKVRESGSEALVIPTDLRIDEQIDNLFKKTMEQYGRLDILVNNAGVFDGGPIDKIPAEAWDNVLGVNLRAPALCTRAAFSIMKEQGGGRIINIGSISASRVRQMNAPYSSAKFGLVGLTQATALEGREFNITCGILHPGNVVRDTQNRPVGGWANEPKMAQEELAAAVVYMACQPPHVNVLELLQLPKDQPYLGRG